VARSYGEIAPEIPHALHMPSHIFTRLGLWQESIVMNQRSAAAALEHPAGEKISLHYPHALDYLAYAYLQRAEDAKAKDVLNTVKSIEGTIQAHVATAYTFAAVPARFALERQQWAEAAALEPRAPSTYGWNTFPAMEAITHFARALGAARSGKAPVARQALDTLTALHQQAAETSAYWAKQIEIQRLAAQAWLTYQEGKPEEALHTMRQAAEMEAATEKHPVTPGEILPARELLADMLLARGIYEEAQTQYLAALERSPNRFNSLYGAGRAAELGGDGDKAALYYRKLVEVTAADAKRERLQQAKTFLATH
jgi:tetratricopeptide (TPR) repeat protein